jgi:PAS domain-containing protein
MAADARPEDFARGRVAVTGAKLVHKYADALDVDLTLDLGGTDTQRIFVINIRRRNTMSDALMVTDHKGRITFATTSLAVSLGYSVKQMKKMDLNKLMPQPFSELHAAWLKARATERGSRGEAGAVCVRGSVWPPHALLSQSLGMVAPKWWPLTCARASPACPRRSRRPRCPSRRAAAARPWCWRQRRAVRCLFD